MTATTYPTPAPVLVHTYGATTVHEMDGSRSGAHLLSCSRCGERVRYALREFTVCEADRHERWCAINYRAKVTS